MPNMPQAPSELSASQTTPPVVVLNLSFRPASPSEVESGLDGFVSFNLSRLMIVHRVAVRRTMNGHSQLTYPRSTRRSGRSYRDFRPASAAIEQEIERQVFALLRSNPCWRKRKGAGTEGE